MISCARRRLASPVASIDVEVCYAGPQGQWLLRVRLPAGATVGDAIEASGIRARIPELGIDDENVGVFSRPRSLSSPLHAGDRVEIYRPLLLDPRAARRMRAARQRQR